VSTIAGAHKARRLEANRTVRTVSGLRSDQDRYRIRTAIAPSIRMMAATNKPHWPAPPTLPNRAPASPARANSQVAFETIASAARRLGVDAARLRRRCLRKRRTRRRLHRRAPRMRCSRVQIRRTLEGALPKGRGARRGRSHNGSKVMSRAKGNLPRGRPPGRRQDGAREGRYPARLRATAPRNPLGFSAREESSL
jgi:hypothetical protein